MIEEALLNYGVAGIMLCYFIYDKVKFQKSIWMVINNNTIALTKIYEVMTKCKKK